jgi:hypothetical protein
MLHLCDKHNLDLIIEKFWRIVSEDPKKQTSFRVSCGLSSIKKEFPAYSQILSWHNNFRLPANTGNDSNNKMAVINIAHTNKGNLCNDKPLVLMLRVVLMKLIAPNNELTPARCKLKIAKSTEPPECDCIPAKGG